MAERARVREISNEEGNRLLRIVRRRCGSVVTRRRAQVSTPQRRLRKHGPELDNHVLAGELTAHAALRRPPISGKSDLLRQS